MRRDGVELESLRSGAQRKYFEEEKRAWKNLAAEKEASAQDAIVAPAASAQARKAFLLRPMVPGGEAKAAASAPQEPVKERPARERKRAKPFGDGPESLGDKERKRLREAADAVCLRSRM